MVVLQNGLKQDFVQIRSRMVTAWLLNVLLSYKQIRIAGHVLPNHSPSPPAYAGG